MELTDEEKTLVWIALMDYKANKVEEHQAELLDKLIEKFE